MELSRASREITVRNQHGVLSEWGCLFEPSVLKDCSGLNVAEFAYRLFLTDFMAPTESFYHTFVFGRIEYVDAFRKPRWTNFRFTVERLTTRLDQDTAMQMLTIRKAKGYTDHGRFCEALH